jgi:high-affinity Fe2+/Pb2+ permease
MAKIKPAEVRKALVAAATGVSELVTLGVVPDPAVPYVMAALAALGVYGVYAVKNQPAA